MDCADTASATAVRSTGVDVVTILGSPLRLLQLAGGTALLAGDAALGAGRAVAGAAYDGTRGGALACG